VLLPITFQLLRCFRFLSGRIIRFPFASRAFQTDENTDASLCIGLSDCEACWLVSLTQDVYLIFNDLSGDEIGFNYYWRRMIIRLSFGLSMFGEDFNLKESAALISI